MGSFAPFFYGANNEVVLVAKDGVVLSRMRTRAPLFNVADDVTAHGGCAAGEETGTSTVDYYCNMDGSSR